MNGSESGECRVVRWITTQCPRARTYIFNFVRNFTSMIVNFKNLIKFQNSYNTHDIFGKGF